MSGAGRNVDAFGLEVARILKAHYEECGESLRAIAPKVGVHFTQMGRFLNGAKPMTLDEFALVCEALNADPVRVIEVAERASRIDVAPRPSRPFEPAVEADDELPDFTQLAARTVTRRPGWDASQVGTDAGEEPQD